MENWTEEQWTELRAVYYGMCARVDHQFGLIMDALREEGMYDDSAVFMFPDHGDWTGDYGLVEKHAICFEDALTRVPFVVKPPSDVPVQPRVSEAMVELIDFPATVEELTGIEMTQPHFGKSLLPVLAGETDELRDAVFCEGGRLESEPWVAQADAPKNLDSDGLYWPKQSLGLEDLVHLGKSTMCRTKTHKLIKRLYESDELYDLEKDPEETYNVIDDPAYTQVLQGLERRMLQFFMETSDVCPAGIDNRE
jgi:arylsulfatase A-like enzyme